MSLRWGDGTAGSGADSVLTVELCMRSNPAVGVETRKQTLVDALEALERADVIDDYTVSAWPEEIRPTGPLEGTDLHRSVMAHVREFEHWLRQHGAAPEFTFGRRTVSSSIVDEEYGVVVLPCMCLAIYEDGELVDLYPRREGETMYTLDDCIERLEAGDGSVAVGEPVR